MEALARVLDDLVEIVGGAEQDTTWAARWDTGGEMIRELRDLAERLGRGDASALGELDLLFLPTGPLQEVSISNGWADRFLVLAGRFDRARAHARGCRPGRGE